MKTQPYEKDVPLADAIRHANEVFTNSQPFTEEEVIAAVCNIKDTHPDIKGETHDTYMRIVREKVFPKGMFFKQITGLQNENGRFQVDWMDLCFEGKKPTTEEEKQELRKEQQALLSKVPANIKISFDETRIGGFEYRLRSRFIK
jgi:hypothetical protein